MSSKKESSGRKELKYILSLLLALLLGLTAATGFIQVALDLNRFIFHKYFAYLTVFLTGVHVYLNREAVVSYLRRALPSPAEGTGGTPLLVGSDAGTVKWEERTFVRQGGPRAVARSPSRPLRAKVKRRDLLIGSLAFSGGFLLNRVTLGVLFGGRAPQDNLLHPRSTREGYGSLLARFLGQELPPPLYKNYSEAKKIELPSEFTYRGLTVEEAIETRRSIRDFIREPMSLDQVSGLLHYAGGITGRSRVSDRAFRASPSAGALYPIEIYPIINNVEGLEKGIYHYSVQNHSLELIKKGNYALDLIQQAIGQEMVGQANLTLVMTAIFGRTTWKYGDRGYRYIYMEAGHIAENVYLAATSMGLGACVVGAFFDDGINELIGVDGSKESTICLVAAGKK